MQTAQLNISPKHKSLLCHKVEAEHYFSLLPLRLYYVCVCVAACPAAEGARGRGDKNEHSKEKEGMHVEILLRSTTNLIKSYTKYHTLEGFFVLFPMV